MVWVPKAFLEGWNRRLDLHISLLTRGKPNTIAVAGCWLVETQQVLYMEMYFP